MKETIGEFHKPKDFLVCIDSDGCAMDTMEINHKRCFGPKVVEVWGLQSISVDFIEAWNCVNLYSKTRGINRFKGLVKTFEILAAKSKDVPDFSSVLK
ncbi:MAG: hypothetical protein GX962_17325 [Epulopiscium sp.]|nr:hypothetical protein [Candidatus Epulonipiscium sp.]